MPSCEQALKQLDETKKENDQIKKKWEDNLESYKRWQKKHQEWKDKQGDFEKYKKYDGVNREFWAKETDGTCWWGENWNDANNWCHDFANKKGYDGENYWAKEWGWCYGRWGNFKCKKDDDIVKNQLDEYKKAEPRNDPQTGTTWVGYPQPAQPLYLPLPEIKCCQTMNYDNIKASAIKFDNISQSCTINEITSKQPVTMPLVRMTPIRTLAPATTSMPSKSNNTLIISIILVCICILIVFSLGGLFVLNKK